MIHRIFSSLPSFKELEFKPGLNVLIAQKEAGASDKQTRNRAGKTSLVEIIHFLAGSEAGKESLFRSPALADEMFDMEFDVGREKTVAKRSGMMLMRLCAKRNIGPAVLVHDSHIFDGVDGRQVISALKVGAETARDLGFQYIVTMNEDHALKEKIDGFNLREYVLPVVLTDATEDGGLFGIRF